MENAEDLHKDGGRYYRAIGFYYVANFFLLPLFVIAVTMIYCTKFGKRHEKTIDKFCEAYIGLYGKFITLPPITPEMKVAVDAIIELRDWIMKNRNLITDDSSMQNIIDESVELCNTTIYKLQKLK